MMKIVLTRSMLEGDIRYIKDGLDKSIGGRYEFCVPEEFSEEGIISVCRDADVLLGPFVTKAILDKCENLKLIQVPWTGMDTFDFSAVKGVDISVCNTHSNADSVAELGVTMLLDLLKKTSYHDRKMRMGNWNRDQKPLDLKSKMINKQTVCIFGYGNIGSRLGKMLNCLGAKIIAVDENQRDSEYVSKFYSSAEIDSALALSDVVICTLPLTDSTRGMFNSALFEKMNDGTVLINLSRAAVVDEDSVWEALLSGKVGAFASDVWWNTPKRGETKSYPSLKHDFCSLDIVLMSPHRAGFIENSLPHLDGAIENLIALCNGEKLMGIVDVNRGF